MQPASANTAGHEGPPAVTRYGTALSAKLGSGTPRRGGRCRSEVQSPGAARSAFLWPCARGCAIGRPGCRIGTFPGPRAAQHPLLLPPLFILRSWRIGCRPGHEHEESVPWLANQTPPKPGELQGQRSASDPPPHQQEPGWLCHEGRSLKSIQCDSPAPLRLGMASLPCLPCLEWDTARGHDKILSLPRDLGYASTSWGEPALGTQLLALRDSGMISPSLHAPNPGLPRGHGGLETSPPAGGTATPQPLPPSRYQPSIPP